MHAPARSNDWYTATVACSSGQTLGSKPSASCWVTKRYPASGCQGQRVFPGVYFDSRLDVFLRNVQREFRAELG